ncbi:hypothetical protein [Candidatus Methylopumilus turicensis]|nr:hypothetical protein [Candidatus Methylopumilus turicensis]
MLSGCATKPNKISAAYVSPLQYKDYDCKQLGNESERVNRRVTDLNASLQKKADGDNAKVAVGMILFFPTLFFTDGDGPEVAEYSRLKGEAEALQKAVIEKKCG